MKHVPVLERAIVAPHVSVGPGAEPPSGVRQAASRWARRGFWAVADQGLFAVSNFVIGVLLARWLSPTEYGSFSIAYSIFLFVGTLHTSLLTEPMLVFGSAKYAAAFSSYLRQLLRGHWLVAGPGGVALALVGLGMQLFASSPVAPSLICTGLTTPFLLWPWLARRACFARLQPQWAAAAGSVYLGLMSLGAYLLFRTQSLSAVTAILLLAVCSAIVGVGLVAVLLRGQPEPRSPVDVREVLADHWSYGRWALLGSAVGWFPSNVYFLLLPAEGGLAASAALKALMNLILPVLHGIAALATLLLPSLVRVRGKPAFTSTLVTALVLLMSGAALYWILVATFAQPLLLLLYKGRYAYPAGLLWMLGALPVAAAFAAVLGAAVRAIERPSDVFLASLGAAATAATLGPWLVVQRGVVGAVIGLIASSMATGLLLLMLLVRRTRTLRDTGTLGALT